MIGLLDRGQARSDTWAWELVVRTGTKPGPFLQLLTPILRNDLAAWPHGQFALRSVLLGRLSSGHVYLIGPGRNEIGSGRVRRFIPSFFRSLIHFCGSWNDGATHRVNVAQKLMRGESVRRGSASLRSVRSQTTSIGRSGLAASARPIAKRTGKKIAIAGSSHPISTSNAPGRAREKRLRPPLSPAFHQNNLNKYS